jgi:hypothetical protein
MGRISALTELTSLASNDYLLVLDSSANIAKKISVANAFGIPDLGWTASGETWTYSSWTASTRTGTITVPTDATTKYSAGMRIKLTQTTGGTKYGIITAVAATLLTIFFPSGTTLNNETISTPYYSTLKIPYGFNPDPSIWSLQYLNTSDVSTSGNTANTWYFLAGHSLVVPVGAWRVSLRVYLYSYTSSGSTIEINGTLSKTSATVDDRQLLIALRRVDNGASGIQSAEGTLTTYKNVILTSQTTYYFNMMSPQTTVITRTGGTQSTTVIEALCNYL